MANVTLSVALISLNEEDRIVKTLESIAKIADEIILIDTNSTDKTAEIAKSYGARIYSEDWKGYVEQKNSLTEKCTKDWILYLDCDEVLTDELQDEIKRKISDKNLDIDGYFINRRSYYLGKRLEHSWQPDERLRLVKASASPLWKGEFVHEELIISGKVSKLNYEMLHFTYRDITDHFTKMIKYAKLSAMSYNVRGKKSSFKGLLFSPMANFFKHYIMKRGFLDGKEGLIIATSSYTYTFLKYAFLWSLNKKK